MARSAGAQRHAAGVRRRPAGGCMRRPLPLGLSPRSGRSLAPGRLFRAALRAPNIPLTAAPHGVGCEVTRGDPGGGGGALFRRSSGRSFRYSLVLEVHPRPPTTFPAAPPARFVLTSPPCPAPPLSGEALATKLALVAPGTGSSATLFESERRRRLSTNLCNAGAGCVGPHHRTPSGSRLRIC